MESQPPKFLVAIGASAGGLNALIELTSRIPPTLDAAYCIALHLSSKGVSDYLVNQLKPHTQLTCRVATNNAIIARGHLYVAPPDTHLMAEKGSIIVGHGAKENRWRPSVDVLFRSVAVAYNTRAVGIVLTGLLDDGTAGMQAIQRCGGISMVQDPNEAEFPDMPLSVLNAMDVNYCVRLEEMYGVLETITSIDRHEAAPPPDIVAESTLAMRMATSLDNVKALGEQTTYVCPDCGGTLFEIADGNLTRYRCFVGHSFSERDLLIKQAETLETTLWVALRMMEERRNMLLLMKARIQKKGLLRSAREYEDKADELLVHIDRLKEALFSAQRNAQP